MWAWALSIRHFMISMFWVCLCFVFHPFCSYQYLCLLTSSWAVCMCTNSPGRQDKIGLFVCIQDKILNSDFLLSHLQWHNHFQGAFYWLSFWCIVITVYIYIIICMINEIYLYNWASILNNLLFTILTGRYCYYSNNVNKTTVHTILASVMLVMCHIFCHILFVAVSVTIFSIFVFH